MTRLIGVVHLAALPGSPLARLGLDAVIDRARADALALEAGGSDGIIVENFNDMPFLSDAVEPHTVAAMTAACLAVREAVSCDIGVNVLRNDAAAALGIAVATGARFIRVNVHTGAMLTDQGIVAGKAHETLRLRRRLGAEHVEIWADVLVKHAAPLALESIGQVARDTVERGLADALIVSGSGTGVAADPGEVRDVASAVGVPVYVGSGVTGENVEAFVPPASGVVVGTWLKRDGVVSNPVDPERVRRLRTALDSAVTSAVAALR